MATAITKNPGPIVLVGEQNGITVIPSPTPLTRLNYFDGKFLRAADLQSEQRYLRSLVEYSNKAGGHGVAYGYDVSLAGGGLQIGQGLAIDAEGRVLLLPQPVALNIQELVQRSGTTSGSGLAQSRALPGAFGDCIVAAAAPPAEALESGSLYVITVAHAEALCGEEDVFGKLCEEACVTSTDRPYRLEGVVVRARPLQLLTPLPASAAVPLNQSHLRSRVASAYFATERLRTANHISKAGLESAMWCFGAQADSGSEVPIGVFGLAGSAVLFLDAWIARRERIDTPAKRYWQWRMRMRPWDVFLAQVLQFQCQLHDLFVTTPPDGGADDPCAEARSLVAEAAGKFDEVTRFYATVSSRLAALNVATLPGGLSALTAFNERLAVARQVLVLPASDRRLIRGGIIELPSAGYLPVVPGSTLTVNAQVRQLLGEGVDLRFCVVRPDFVAHALEEAQHMDRISLTQGLDDPSSAPRVDILVPNGEIVRQERRIPGAGWDAAIQFAPGGQSTDNPPAAALTMRGAARTATLDSGGAAAYAAGAAQADDVGKLAALAAALGRVGDVRDTAHFETLRKLSEEASAAKADPDLFANLNRLAAESAKFAATGKAAQPKFTSGVAASIDRFRPGLGCRAGRGGLGQRQLRTRPLRDAGWRADAGRPPARDRDADGGPDRLLELSMAGRLPRGPAAFHRGRSPARLWHGHAADLVGHYGAGRGLAFPSESPFQCNRHARHGGADIRDPACHKPGQPDTPVRLGVAGRPAQGPHAHPVPDRPRRSGQRDRDSRLAPHAKRRRVEARAIRRTRLRSRRFS
jgi:hypothetical protein